MPIEKITESEFRRAEGEKAIVEFYSPDCVHCKVLAGTLEELAAENPTIPLYKVDVSEEGSLAARFGIRSVPTLIRLENGKIREKKVGAVGKKELLSLLLS